MAAAVIGGPREVALVAPTVALACNMKRRLPLYKTIFNMATYVLAGLAFVAVYDALRFGSPPAAWPKVLVPALVAAVAYYLVNAGLVTGAVSLAGHRDL